MAEERERLLELLQELLRTHSPVGQEEEIDGIVRREYEQCCDEVWTDEADNIVGRMKGSGRKVMVCAHRDEICMIVKRIEEDGKIRVRNLGGCLPWKYGEGPVDILTDRGIVTGILSVGSTHVSDEEGSVVAQLRRNRALTWNLVYVFTGMTKAEIMQAGIRPGTRVVVSRARKEPVFIGDCLCDFALDDRVGVAVQIEAMRMLASEARTADFYFVASTSEEKGGLGASYAAGRIGPDLTLAIDGGPIAPEYDLHLGEQPVIWYADDCVAYDREESDRLFRIAEELGFGAQCAVYSNAATDASISKSYGLTGKAIAAAYARENSHGYEITSVTGVLNLIRMVVAYLAGME